ncbi:amidohydrolase family protein [Celerinatantimonas sp. YJH-8]|uniref:amidohydrolase family protein n=1 Tax=Celerinatantimonas sp. YJH-8 TaxID=3228714 RepID=UPI0038C0AC34
MSGQRAVVGIDSHAHIFNRHLPMVTGRRYTPAYDASLAQWFEHMARFGISHGVLIQPSFLGTDNHHLLQALATYPDRLRGVVVIEPSIQDQELEAMSRAGVVGARLNLMGKSLTDYLTPQWQSLYQRLAKRHWHVELHRHSDDIAQMIEALLPYGLTIVVDHFGRPQGPIDPQHPGEQAFLQALSHPSVWLKISASYRNGVTLEQARQMWAQLVEASGGHQRMVWGSDWPHTQHEDMVNYESQYQTLSKIISDSLIIKKILVDNPSSLFGF